MARRNLSAVVRYLQQLTGSARASGASDAELLERYVRHRDETAFELLLWRHGTLVFNVCRRILSCQQDAEDAFQATFLAFVRKAGSISRRGSVASWLYKVAYRVALEARERTRKTAAMEQSGGERLGVQSVADPLWSDVRLILDDEVNRLPERLRRPIVLCYLEGRSNAEAARELGCRLGTIYSRLARGREMLRRRLLRRGVTLSVAGLTAALTTGAAEAAPAIHLMRTTVQAALSFAEFSAATAISPRVAALAEGVLRTMFVTKLKIAAVMLFVATVLAAGGVLSHGLTAAPQPEAKAKEPPTKARDDDKKYTEPVRVKVVKPKKGSLQVFDKRPAEIIASQQQQVCPLVSGTIKEVLVDLGDRVKKGQTLIVLDAPLLAKEGEQAASAFEMAQAEQEEAEAQVIMAEAEVEAAEAVCNAKEAEKVAAISARKGSKAMLDRLRSVAKNVVAITKLKEAENKVAAAEAQVKVAEAAVAAARADIKIKKGKLLHAKAALKAAGAAARNAHAVMEKARIQVSFTQLKAAFDGVVTRRTIDPGNYVEPSDSRVLRPLLILQRLDSVRVVAPVPGNLAPYIERGTAVEVEMPRLKRRQYKITRFSPTIDSENRTMNVEIDVPNADHRIRPGMVGQVKIVLRKPSAEGLIVPSASVVTQGGKFYVFVVRGGKAHLTPITVSVDDGKKAEIAKGIKTSDLIAVNNQGELEEGTPVTIEKAP